MKKIKIIALILALFVAVAALTACGDEKETPEASTPDYSVDSGSQNGSENNGSEPDNGSEDNGSEDAGSEDNGSEQGGNENGGGSGDASGVAAAALKLANELIGTEYKSGGVGPDTFDNSGFIYYIFRQSGYKMPRSIPDMAKEGTEVGRDGLKAGDVLIFSNDIGGDPAFVAISAGNDQFISCNRSDRPTALQKFSNYYEQRFICGRRIG